MAAVAKDSVEGICSKIYQLSAEYSRRLRQTHLSLLQDLPAGDAAWTRPPRAAGGMRGAQGQHANQGVCVCVCRGV